jgi:hypothetical protein
MELVDMDSRPAPIPVRREDSNSAHKQKHSSKTSMVFQHAAITYVIETSLYSSSNISYRL